MQHSQQLAANSKDLIPGLSSIRPKLIRQLFSVEQYKRLYEDIVCGYIEFLKPKATRKQIQDAHTIKRIRLANVSKHKVSKPYRQYREPFRSLDLRGIYHNLSDEQFEFLINLILTHYCDTLCSVLPADMVNTVQNEYINFLTGTK